MYRAIITIFFPMAFAVSLYGQQLSSAVYTATFNNIGMELTFSGETPAASSVTAAICDARDQSKWRDCHPLSRVAANRFVGSAFGLLPNTKYLIRLRGDLITGDRIDSALTRSDTFPLPGGAVYHVAKNGSDANNGSSIDKAFASLSHALSTAQPGATILLHAGHYFESVTLPRSGSQNAPILFRNAPGEIAVLDGRDTSFMPSWTQYDATKNIFRAACKQQPNLAYYNGEHLFANPSLSDLVNSSWSMSSGFFCDGAWMYVRLAHAGAPTTSDTVQIPAYTTAITCSGKQFIQIKGLEICYYGLAEYSRGIYFDGSSNNLVDSCFLHHSGIGVTFKRASNFNTVQNCRFTESPIDTWNWSAVKEGTGYYEAGGVVVYGSSSLNSGNVIRNNWFFHMFDGSHLFSDDATGPTMNMDFCGNVVEHVNDDCIETDGAGSNCRIYNNVFRTFLSGVSVAPAAGGPTYIFRNVFTGWEQHGVYVGYPIKFNVDSPLSTDWVYIYHNTCYTSVSAQPGFLFKDYSDWHNVISRNNIFAGTGYALESWSDQNPVDFDYDALYTTATGDLINWAGTKYRTIAAFSAATGFESHGISGNPLFVNASAGDFHLSEGSPLIDKAAAIPGISDVFSGNGPDIGCFEHGANSVVSDANRIKGKTAYAIYSDAATGRVFIRFAHGRTPLYVDVKIFSPNGRRIYSCRITGCDDCVRLPNNAILRPGVYCAQVTSGSDVHKCYFATIK
jgi:hypothetical protein